MCPKVLGSPKGRHKGDGGRGNWAIDLIFVINRKFLKKIFRKSKNVHEKKCLLFPILHMLCKFH